VHIPKTAGATVTNMFNLAYSRSGVHSAGNFIRGPETTVNKVTKRPGGWQNWHRRGGRVTVGHVPYGVFREHLPEDTRYMTFLREPVDRVLSHYYRHLHLPEMSPEEKARRRQTGKHAADSLEEALVEMKLPQLSNLATRFLCGDPSPMVELPASALDDAKANLREFAFVGIKERFEESIVLLQRTFELDLLPYLNRHVSLEGTRPSVEEISREERQLIEKHNQLDAELYAFSLELFDNALGDTGHDIATDADRVRALSAAADRDATQRALEWLERALPPGTTRDRGILCSAAKADGVSVPVLKKVMNRTSVQVASAVDGKKRLMRLEQSDEPPPRPDRNAGGEPS
jgi:hypothetical protein